MTSAHRLTFGVALILALAAATRTLAGNASVPGPATLEAPTFICLGVRWVFGGDDNRNATATIEYRKKGQTLWKRGLNLFRADTDNLRGWTVPAGQSLFAGSVFDLEPATDYELKLTLADPDGGKATQTLKAKTWSEPMATRFARVLHVAPGTGAGNGSASKPFRGMAAASSVQPGDLVLIHRGTYPGAWSARSGEPGAPVVYRGAGDGEVVFDGQNAKVLVSAYNAHDVMFEDLTFRNADWTVVAHGGSDITVRRCKFLNTNNGFSANTAGSKRIVVVDSVFEGPCTWPRTKGIEGIEGVAVLGEGHVVAYNRFRGFGDAVSIYKSPSHAIDFYNNDISECTDDGIEMDSGGQNVRCFRNRLTNCFQGISAQPLHGGPCYIFRNALYNIEIEPFKLHNSPSGVLVFHNTTVKAAMPLILATPAKVRKAVFRNNLFVGTADSHAMEISPPMEECDWDYDGFAGGPWGAFAQWNGRNYASLKALAAAGVERHGVLVDPRTLFATGVLPPNSPKKQFPLSVNDLRLKDGSGAIDRGEPLPNINDGFKGDAPDLGAYELGEPLPHYGPRPPAPKKKTP